MASSVGNGLQIYSAWINRESFLIVPFQNAPNVLHFFQNASNLLSSVADHLEVSKNVSREQGLLGKDASDWPQDIREAVGDEKCHFMVATITVGLFREFKAIGVGSNKEKQMRSSNLALAISILRSPMRPLSLSIEVQQLWSVCPDVVVSSRSLATSSALPGSQVPSTARLAQPEAQSAGSTQMQSSEARVTHDLEVLDAKCWLVRFRQQRPELTTSEVDAVKHILKSGGAWTPKLDKFGGDTCSRMSALLRLVLQCDRWKGEPCGHFWVKDWEQWRDPFDCTNPWQDSVKLGKKQQKRYDQWLWHFGSMPCPGQILHPMSPSVTYPSQTLSPNLCTQFSTEGAELLRVGQPQYLGLFGQVSSNFATTLQNNASKEEEEDRRPLQTSLQTKTSTCDTMSISAFSRNGSGHTVLNPIDTAALLTEKSHAIVVDGDSVGLSYGQLVVGKEKHWSKQGVIEAIDHLKNKWSKILLVTRSRWLKDDPDTPAVCEIVFAQGDDDPIILQLSYKHKCAVLSQDRYGKQMNDTRLEPEVREWWKAISLLEFGWSWSDGNFIMKYSLVV